LDRANEILNQKGKLLTEIYFELQRYYEERYGPDALVFIEVGNFFEVYEVNNVKGDSKRGQATFC